MRENEQYEDYYVSHEDNDSKAHNHGAMDTKMGENPDTYSYERVEDTMFDENSCKQHDGRAETNTGWDPSDMDTKKEKNRWRYLNTLNDGYRSSERKQQNREAGRRHDAKTLMSQLRCSEYQREHVMELLESFDGGSMGGTTTDEALILSLISVVVEEDDTTDREIRKEQKWDELRLTLEVPQWKIGQARSLLGRRDVMSDTQGGGALQYV